MDDSQARSQTGKTFATCACEDYIRAVCTGLTANYEYKGKRYCILHYPNENKVKDFKIAFDKKLANEDFDFRGVWFPEKVDFKNFEFKNTVSFSEATFYKETDFSRAIFCTKVYFDRAIFRAVADFHKATFHKDVYFDGVLFRAKVNFSRAIFSAETDFRRAIFSIEADFRRVIVKDYLLFSDKDAFKDAWLNLQHAKIEKPERVSFHSLTLQPYWFINVDSRKFDFIDVKWDRKGDGFFWRFKVVNEEIKELKGKKIESSHQLLSIACHRLALNAEENNRYNEASDFRYMAMETQRLETWRGWAFWKLRWWYWAASSYGEDIVRAFIVLIGIWLLSAFLYTYVGFVRWEPKIATAKEAEISMHDTFGHPFSFNKALSYSFAVMALQKPEPKPATNTAQALVAIETVIGPLQAALLALAIRRKFMR